jgi:hypothetical protein
MALAQDVQEDIARAVAIVGESGHQALPRGVVTSLACRLGLSAAEVKDRLTAAADALKPKPAGAPAARRGAPSPRKRDRTVGSAGYVGNEPRPIEPEREPTPDMVAAGARELTLAHLLCHESALKFADSIYRAMELARVEA